MGKIRLERGNISQNRPTAKKIRLEREKARRNRITAEKPVENKGSPDKVVLQLKKST